LAGSAETVISREVYSLFLMQTMPPLLAGDAPGKPGKEA
jgi:hypothetical protein